MKTQKYFPFIFDGVDVAVSNKNCSILRWKCNSGFPLRVCWATKYFILLLAIILWVFVYLPFLSVMHFAPFVRRIVMCVLPGRTIFRYVISGTAQFSKKKVFFECQQFCTQYFSIYEEFKEILLYIKRGLHLKYPLFLSDVNETWIFSTDSKFRENSSRGSRVVPHG